MQKRLDYIFWKRNKFKVCKKCNAINWHENEVCVHCAEQDFTETGSKELDKLIDNDYEYYKKEGYSEEEIDSICTEV